MRLCGHIMRFSTRTLLLLTAAAGAACWWFVRPSQIARKFVHAIESNDFVAADACFLDPTELRLKSLYDNSWQFSASAELVSCGIQDVLMGRRHIRFHFAHGEAGPMHYYGGNATVTPLGIGRPWGGVDVADF